MLDEKMQLEVRSLNVHYGEMHALRNVDLDLEVGGVLALLGRNGAGKSTWIHAIMGLLRQTSGSVRLGSKDLSGATPVEVCRAGIGLVPQGRRVFRSLTVEENLIVARRNIHGTQGWSNERVVRLFPRLAERRKSLAGTLSGGEQQMLAIGRALMGNPRILLLDEPSEGLAPQIVEEVSECVRRLRNEGLGVLLVEQNLRLAERLADKVVVLATGEVVFQGRMQDFSQDPDLVETHLGVRHSDSVDHSCKAVLYSQ